MAGTPAEPFPRSEVEDLIAGIVETTRELVIWDHEPRPFAGMISGKPGFWIELSVKSVTPKGIDDQRYQFNPDPGIDVNQLLQYCYRIVTMKILVASNDPNTPSFDIMERIRRRLRSLTAKNALQALNISLINFSPSVDLPREVDNRTQSESTMDVKLGWMVTEDPGDDDGQWIQQVAPITPNLTS